MSRFDMRHRRHAWVVILAAGATLAALRVRRLSGIGQRIDMALFDSAFVTLNTFLGGVLTNKGSSRSRLGNRHPTVAPWNA